MRKPGAFSLVELLVAMVVLTLLVLILAQIMGLASLSWLMGKQRINNLTKARVFLDLIAHDVQDGVFRPDLAAFLDQSGATVSMSSTSYAFYSKRPGGGARSIALLNYKLSQSSTSYSLMRGALPIGWTNPPPSFAGMNAATVGLPELAGLTASNYSEVASGVIASAFILSTPIQRFLLRRMLIRGVISHGVTRPLARRKCRSRFA